MYCNSFHLVASTIDLKTLYFFLFDEKKLRYYVLDFNSSRSQ